MTHLVVNALLLWLGYYWLGIGESRTPTLAWSGFIAFLTICLACSTYGAAFVLLPTGRQNERVERGMANGAAKYVAVSGRLSAR